MTSLYERIFPRWKKDPAYRPEVARAFDDGVSIRWLGTASFEISSGSTTLLVDPYVTRKPLLSMPFSHESDERAIFEAFPSRVDAVLCGHSHYDHVADAPLIAKRAGAKLVGSESTCAWGAAEGIDESQLVRVSPRGGTFTLGDFEVRFVPSLHGRIFLHQVPFPGAVTAPPKLPQPIWAYKMGGAYGILIRTKGLSIYHNGSADLVDTELEDTRADVLLVGLAGRKGTSGYVKRLVDRLEPGLVVPTHHDAFFAPLSRGVHLLPGIDLPGFLSEVGVLSPKSTRVTLDYRETLSIPRGEARGAAIVGG